MTSITDLSLSICLFMFELRETGVWDNCGTKAPPLAARLEDVTEAASGLKPLRLPRARKMSQAPVRAQELKDSIRICAQTRRFRCFVRVPLGQFGDLGQLHTDFWLLKKFRLTESHLNFWGENSQLFLFFWVSFSLVWLNPICWQKQHQFSPFTFFLKVTSSVQFNLIYFQVRLGPGPLRCPSLTRLPVWEPIPGPLLTNHSCSAVGAQIISLRSDDLVVPKLPACGREW